MTPLQQFLFSLTPTDSALIFVYFVALSTLFSVIQWWVFTLLDFLLVNYALSVHWLCNLYKVKKEDL